MFVFYICDSTSGTNYFVISFCLVFSVCFYKVGETVTSPGLEGVALSRHVPMQTVCACSFGGRAGSGAGCVLGFFPRQAGGAAALSGGLELDLGMGWGLLRQSWQDG